MTIPRIARRRSFCRSFRGKGGGPYDMRRLVELVIDRDSGFEIQPTFGRAVFTFLARFSGRPVGVIAHNPAYYGGAVDPQVRP